MNLNKSRLRLKGLCYQMMEVFVSSPPTIQISEYLNVPSVTAEARGVWRQQAQISNRPGDWVPRCMLQADSVLGRQSLLTVNTTQTAI